MPNSIFSATKVNNMFFGTNQLGQLYNVFMRSNNPMSILQNMAINNPQLTPILNALKQGANPEQIFRQLATQNGINPDEFIRTIQGSMR